MENLYITYKRFTDPVAAKELTKFLEEKGIPYKIEDASAPLDVSFANNEILKELHIKLQGSDFDKVDRLLLEEESALTTGDIPDDYYLLEFSNEELMEILIKPDEWSPTDYQLAKVLLLDRGKSIDHELLDTIKKSRIEEKSAPEKSQKTWVFAGYTFALLGGLLGLFIGWHLMTFKKVSPQGKKVYGYMASDRNHGLAIFIIAIISTSINAILWYLNRV